MLKRSHWCPPAPPPSETPAERCWLRHLLLLLCSTGERGTHVNQPCRNGCARAAPGMLPLPLHKLFSRQRPFHLRHNDAVTDWEMRGSTRLKRRGTCRGCSKIQREALLVFLTEALKAVGNVKREQPPSGQDFAARTGGSRISDMQMMHVL